MKMKLTIWRMRSYWRFRTLIFNRIKQVAKADCEYPIDSNRVSLKNRIIF